MTDWTTPLLTDPYASVLSELMARDVDTATCFSLRTSINIPDGAISWSAGDAQWEVWSVASSTWSALSLVYQFHTVVLGADPAAPLQAATKQYVDNSLAAKFHGVIQFYGPGAAGGDTMIVSDYNNPNGLRINLSGPSTTAGVYAKVLQVVNGQFNVLGADASTILFSLDDSGNLSLHGNLYLAAGEATFSTAVWTGTVSVQAVAEPAAAAAAATVTGECSYALTNSLTRKSAVIQLADGTSSKWTFAAPFPTCCFSDISLTNMSGVAGQSGTANQAVASVVAIDVTGITLTLHNTGVAGTKCAVAVAVTGH